MSLGSMSDVACTGYRARGMGFSLVLQPDPVLSALKNGMPKVLIVEKADQSPVAT